MSIVTQAIEAELKELIPKSKYYADQLETAKTKTKRNIMRKRLRANNVKVADLLIALEKLNKKENKNVESSSEGRTETEGPTEKPAS